MAGKKVEKLEKLTEHQFHTVWTVAVGKVGYNKKMFQNVFEELIERGLIKK